MILFAGGASKSELWSQILADVLGIRVKVPVVKEATALGTAIIAGYGVGIYEDIATTAKKLAHIDKTYEPNMKNHEVYNEMYGKWRELYQAELNLANSGLVDHMWKAPGI